MPSCAAHNPLITGVGVTTAVGQGKAAFWAALLAGTHAFHVMNRPGRQHHTEFLGAEIEALAYPESLSERQLRTMSLSTKVACITLHEAWNDARLGDLDPTRIGLIVGGTNFQQRELVLAHDRHRDDPKYVRPTYAMSFLDTDLCAACSELFGIRGFTCTIGGASASGQLAVIHAMHALASYDLDVCMAVGALTDLSHWECQALRSLGAMGSDRYASDAELACRPFDATRDGFIFGEACGVLVIERRSSAEHRKVHRYAALTGGAVRIDARRTADPSLEGETGVITEALSKAGLAPEDIDYVNPHGSGSIIGDVTEVTALKNCGVVHAAINATKSITGHALHAAGAVEIIATALQMQAGWVHPTRNLDEPIDTDLQWVRSWGISHSIRNALSLSFGFGGINTAVCLGQP